MMACENSPPSEVLLCPRGAGAGERPDGQPAGPGVLYHQAWELAREEWAFLPSEEDADAAEDPGR
jgi:hypothetical protein